MKELVEELEKRAAREPAAIVAIDAEGAHTLDALMRAGDALAETLEKVVGREPTVLFQADNTWRTVVVTIAVGRLAGTLALISRHATREEFAAAFADIDPNAVIGSADRAGEWRVGDRLPEIDGEVLDGWRWAGAPGPPAARWGGGVVIGLTSGSTGRAKGVVQSEAALRYAVRCTIDAVGLAPGDAVAALVPMSSSAAFCFGLYLPLHLGGPIVFSDQWDPAAAVLLMARHDVRWTMCVPTMALQLAAAAPEPGLLAGVRAMTVGGGPMDVGALARAERRLGTRILRVFGMSECLGHTTPAVDDPEEIRLGVDGRPFPGTELRAVDENGVPMPPGQPGRAQVRGPSLFLGYARAGAVAPPELTPDGFLVTGDLLAVLPDGTVSVRGREKDIIIRGGRNIDIAEVEGAVLSHPAVEQACVVAVPDDLLGERVAVLVVTELGSFDLETVQRHLSERGLSKGKWPEYVWRVPALPQNRVGKLSRADAARLARELKENASGRGVLMN
jgi:non-ribosomal peptide synthetase component E (peptide arylation enzyme)